MKKRTKKILLITGAILVLLVAGGLAFLQSQRYYPANEAQTSLKLGQEVKVGYYFKGTDDRKPLVVFYQGALVEAGSYSNWAEALSQSGYSVYLLEAPFSLPVLAANQAEQVIEENPQRDFVVGGHSLGGVMASRFANQNSGNTHLKGVFFLASYPDVKGRLDKFSLPVLSIIASGDQVLNQASFKEAKGYLPKNTAFETIQGGNHAGFGDYGKQKGDGQAKITAKEQNQQVDQRLKDWLDQIP